MASNGIGKECLLKMGGSLVFELSFYIFNLYDYLLYLSFCKHDCRPMLDGDGLFQHTNVFQHISMFMGFAMSGLVDLIGMYVPLPEGTEQVI